MKLNWNFLGGAGVQNEILSMGEGCIDILWNCTISDPNLWSLM